MRQIFGQGHNERSGVQANIDTLGAILDKPTALFIRLIIAIEKCQQSWVRNAFTHVLGMLVGIASRMMTPMA